MSERAEIAKNAFRLGKVEGLYIARLLVGESSRSWRSDLPPLHDYLHDRLTELINEAQEDD